MGRFYQKKRINTIGIFFKTSTCRDRPRFKQIIPEFFSGSVKKNSQHVQTKRSVVCKQQAHAGTDLVFSKSSEVIEDCRNQTENIA